VGVQIVLGLGSNVIDNPLIVADLGALRHDHAASGALAVAALVRGILPRLEAVLKVVVLVVVQRAAGQRVQQRRLAGTRLTNQDNL
jgi:hypothetical protein